MVARVPVRPIEIEPAAGALPAEVRAFLADADARIDTFFEQRRHLEKIGFYPSDYELGYRMLKALRTDERQVMCEWGSGFGVVAGLAAMLGYDATAIEIDARLNVLARAFLADHELDVRLLEGSFIPEDYARTERLSDLETITVMTGADVYGDSDVEVEDFEIVFAYPWPNEEPQYCDMFDRFADYGAVLVTYSLSEGMRVYRKVGEDEPEGA